MELKQRRLGVAWWCGKTAAGGSAGREKAEDRGPVRQQRDGGAREEQRQQGAVETKQRQGLLLVAEKHGRWSEAAGLREEDRRWMVVVPALKPRERVAAAGEGLDGWDSLGIGLGWLYR